MDIPELPVELKESSLGVFIKFKEQGFGWASRLVHYMLSFKLDIKKKYEMWSLVGPEPLRFSPLEFENLTGLNRESTSRTLRHQNVKLPKRWFLSGMLGVHPEAGPTTDQIIAAIKRCEDWSTEDHGGSRTFPSSLDSLKRESFQPLHDLVWQG
ncbi:hypothetical protein Bca52824_002587 [Brassica carinata]|uniref:DUF1985 domain-containing protein n=1 Tax=Brassica carinata TaxID=52824 RepID=A0A8X8BF06_BRACI|nr:hypothetical protein Bca52824_002587 [Brassica carinata]